MGKRDASTEKVTYVCPSCGSNNLVKSPWSPKGNVTKKYRSIWFCRDCETPMCRRISSKLSLKNPKAVKSRG